MTTDYKIGKGTKRLIQEANAHVKPESHLALEVLELLTSLYFLRQPFRESNDLIENLRILHLMRLLQDDIALRLCKFTDDDTRSWSFEQAHKKIRKRHGNEDTTKQYLALRDQYRDAMRPIEEHRNSYIAHRSKRDRSHLKLLDFREATRLAVEIVDVFAGQRCSYLLNNIDLRREILADWNSAPA
jgi:hypothetical protein